MGAPALTCAANPLVAPKVSRTSEPECSTLYRAAISRSGSRTLIAAPTRSSSARARGAAIQPTMGPIRVAARSTRRHAPGPIRALAFTWPLLMRSREFRAAPGSGPLPVSSRSLFRAAPNWDSTRRGFDSVPAWTLPRTCVRYPGRERRRYRRSVGSLTDGAAQRTRLPSGRDPRSNDRLPGGPG